MTENYSYGRGRKIAPSAKGYRQGWSERFFETIFPSPENRVPSNKRSRFTTLYGKIYPKHSPPSREGKVSRHELEKAWARRDLSRTLDVVLPSLGIVAGVFLLSGNITGNVISNLSNSDANLAGAFAILIGIVGLMISRRG